MVAVHDERLALGPIRLAGGQVLPEVSVAFAHYGKLASDGRNAVLVGHGYTADHRMLAHGDGVAEGSWSPLIGPGRPLDTDRFFVICTNMLGSCHGTTGPASIDPATGRPYAGSFPSITLTDIVAVQHRLLAALGVRHLRAVVGPSFGGFQALQWALDHPSMVDAIGVVLSAPWVPRSEHTSLQALEARFAQNPAWHPHASREAMFDTLVQLRLDTWASYSGDAVLTARGVPPERRPHQVRALAEAWARAFDPHALFVLLKAALAFDARPHLPRVRADVLYVVSDTDLLFPPDPQALQALAGTASRRPLRHVLMRTAFGHMASGAAPQLWGPALAALLSDEVDGADAAPR